jgi:hypothetical protein
MSTVSFPDRAAFRAAMAEIAVKATEKLPECNGRVDSAVKLVLAGDVELAEDGTARVYSASNGVSSYQVVNGHCECQDFARAPHGFCKHRLSAAILRRALDVCPPEPQETTSVPQTPVDTSAGPDASLALPDAPAGVDPKFVVLIQHKPFVRFAGLLDLAHRRGLQELKVEWTFNDADLSLAHAVAVFPFGRFEESGDATKANVNHKVAPHFRRCALTRASARALRLALGLDMVAVEELMEGEA